MTDDETEPFVGPEPKSSGHILAALNKSEREFNDWQALCDGIDDRYSLIGSPYGGYTVAETGWNDTTLDLFWASFEVLKPAVYAKAPVPAVASMFSDNKPLDSTTAELLERTAISAFTRTNIQDVMCHVRDDVLFAGRGVMWLTYETKDGEQCIHVEHLDRRDFRHEQARYWSEVGWVARGAWLTKKEARKRFTKFSGDAYQNAKYTVRRDDQSNVDSQSTTQKAQFWEVWHKADSKVYWVAEGVDKILDSGEPHLDLKGFFPCPRPAYGTLRRRSLVPVPDWSRYALHFAKINTLTGRIYLLLDSVRMKGLIPAGGDVGTAVEQLMAANDDQILIPVPSAAMLGDGMSNFVQWLPLAEITAAIQGLIAARTQLISDFYELSGISDIMRGATEADETLGAQRLKSQYGSVRVREKIDELQRVAADTVKIMAEIISERFTKETLLEMSRMEIPTASEIDKRIKQVEEGANDELEALGAKMRQAIHEAEAKQAEMEQQGQETDPAEIDAAKQAAQQALQEGQQAIIAKYAPMLQEAEGMVPIEDVMKLLRDDRTRGFSFEIASDSTIMTDEMQEKASRNEFMTEFTGAMQGLMGLMAMGEQGANLAGEMMKFVLAPYRAGRQLDGAINAFIDTAPEQAKAAQAQAGQQTDNEALNEANNKLAEAEQMKAQAAMAGVQARSALDQANNQRKMAELQAKMQNDAAKSEQESQRLQLQLADYQASAAKTEAEIDKLRAQTAEILSSIGLDVRKQELTEYQAADDAEARRVEQAKSAEQAEIDRDFRERGDQRETERHQFGMEGEA